MPTHVWELFVVGNQYDSTLSKLQTFKLTSLSSFPNYLMEFLHMPKKLNGSSDWILSHGFPTRKHETMIGENWWLVTYEPIEFEKLPVTKLGAYAKHGCGLDGIGKRCIKSLIPLDWLIIVRIIKTPSLLYTRHPNSIRIPLSLGLDKPRDPFWQVHLHFMWRVKFCFFAFQYCTTGNIKKYLSNEGWKKSECFTQNWRFYHILSTINVEKFDFLIIFSPN